MERREKKKQTQIFAFSFMQQISPGFTVENIQQTKKRSNFSQVYELSNLFLSVSILFSMHLYPENNFEEMDLSILLPA